MTLICIKQTGYLTLFNNTTGSLFVDDHYVGDKVEIEGGLIKFIGVHDEFDKGKLYIGSATTDSNNYYGTWNNGEVLKECFINPIEWRDRQIDSIIN